MKKFVLIFLFLLLASFSYHLLSKETLVIKAKVTASIELKDKRIKQHIESIRDFLKKKSEYSSEMVFLVDMKIMSGKNRFFIYDLNKNEVVDQGLVAHGCGSETGEENQLKFSNIDNSLATSLGKYAIGESYQGQFGKAYKLYGLDTSNSNAFLRNIVLHKYSKMPYEEQESTVCNSYGCPMVNETYFKRIEKILDNSKKKILLKIYY